MKRKTLTASVKRKITKDWNECFPSMGIYKPMHLLRRVGPLLIGVALERDSGNDNYRPTFHVHILCRSRTGISLSMSRRLIEYVMVGWHERKYREMVDRFAKEVFLPLEGNLTVGRVFSAYTEYFQRPMCKYEPYSYEDMALIAAWAGKSALSRDIVEKYTLSMQKWPEYVLKKSGSAEEWSKRILTLVDDPDKIRQTVDQEIEKHGLEAIPVSQLLPE